MVNKLPKHLESNYKEHNYPLKVAMESTKAKVKATSKDGQIMVNINCKDHVQNQVQVLV